MEALEALKMIESPGNAAEEIFRDPRSGDSWKNDQALRKVYWDVALRDAGVKRREPKQTRHTYASQLLTDGANPLYVAQQMGHKDWGMIRKVYGRYIANNGRGT